MLIGAATEVQRNSGHPLRVRSPDFGRSRTQRIATYQHYWASRSIARGLPVQDFELHPSQTVWRATSVTGAGHMRSMGSSRALAVQCGHGMTQGGLWKPNCAADVGPG